MILVINEWIFENLIGENGQDRFKETAEFVVKLSSSDDKLVMPVKQKWREKANRARTVADPVQRTAGRLFVDLFWDQARGIILNSADIPANSTSAYNWAPSEDVYLIEAYFAAGADLLVTTGERLNQAIAEHQQFACQLRDEFLSTYTPDR